MILSVATVIVASAFLMEKHHHPQQTRDPRAVVHPALTSSSVSDDSSFSSSKKEPNANTGSPAALQRFYPIGTPGQPWNEKERAQWKALTKIQRSYDEQVLAKIRAWEQDDCFQVCRYGALAHNPDRYPLYAVQTRHWQPEKPNVLITGGVHGYETSGVQGALLFLQTRARSYAPHCNLVVVPCVSPWAYEHIQRWNADLQDPNRSFLPQQQTPESQALMEYLAQLLVPTPDSRKDGDGTSTTTTTNTTWTCHVDLHETTDTDATEFMPAKHAAAGLPYDGEVIPDGFYLVADDANPQLDFQKAIIDRVRQVTHIAPPDAHGNIIDEPVVQEGVIVVPARTLGLCGGVTGGTFTTTTEVYPDSPGVTDEICNQAQVAAITGALDFCLAQHASSS